MAAWVEERALQVDDVIGLALADTDAALHGQEAGMGHFLLA